MSLSLLITVVLLAVIAVPHCATMCGLGFARPWLCGHHGFFCGRAFAYGLLGGVAGGANQILSTWVIEHAGVLSALQWMLHAVVVFMALSMIFFAKSPEQWVPIQGIGVRQLGAARHNNAATTPLLRLKTQGLRAFRAGALWMGMPCGVLYSAVSLAWLSGSWWAGCVQMLLFAALTQGSLQAASWVNNYCAQWASETLLVRLGGALMLLALSVSVLQHFGVFPSPVWMQGMALCF